MMSVLSGLTVIANPDNSLTMKNAGSFISTHCTALLCLTQSAVPLIASQNAVVWRRLVNVITTDSRCHPLRWSRLSRVLLYHDQLTYQEVSRHLNPETLLSKCIGISRLLAPYKICNEAVNSKTSGPTRDACNLHAVCILRSYAGCM